MAIPTCLVCSKTAGDGINVSGINTCGKNVWKIPIMITKIPWSICHIHIHCSYIDMPRDNDTLRSAKRLSKCPEAIDVQGPSLPSSGLPREKQTRTSPSLFLAWLINALISLLDGSFVCAYNRRKGTPSIDTMVSPWKTPWEAASPFGSTSVITPPVAICTRRGSLNIFTNWVVWLRYM